MSLLPKMIYSWGIPKFAPSPIEIFGDPQRSALICSDLFSATRLLLLALLIYGL